MRCAVTCSGYDSELLVAHLVQSATGPNSDTRFSIESKFIDPRSERDPMMGRLSTDRRSSGQAAMEPNRQLSSGGDR
ncbi:hypothetical protein DV706_11020 [Natronorubrum bangense]|uniref:Uncharacterized protein n=2 Tax=Natronorubrum bangense TaxID=61858 RepID=L9WQP4_9EURY|nr:hypothetical protein C494_01731 [Natronorubrum bangense JCM 10635]QCC54950.1 hypothetical protein DV706_11020 [Natronorubrum bangense]